MKNTTGYRAGQRILDVAREHPERVALIIDDDSWTYAELVTAAASIARQFEFAGGDSQPITAVMAQRHVSSYVGILAARLAGHAYVLENGHMVMQGTGQSLLNDDRVRQAYLGL